jgi:hypothetical protein
MRSKVTDRCNAVKGVTTNFVLTKRVGVGIRTGQSFGVVMLTGGEAPAASGERR